MGSATRYQLSPLSPSEYFPEAEEKIFSSSVKQRLIWQFLRCGVWRDTFELNFWEVW